MKLDVFLPALAVMAVVTYLVRAVPFGLIQKKITNRYFCSVLYYIPYCVLTAMTFPAILTCTASLASAIVGLLVACVLAYRGKGLVMVALAACAAVFLTSLVEPYIISIRL